MPSLDVVIPVKNRCLSGCVDSLRQLGDRLQTILICDGASTHPETVVTLSHLAAVKGIKILQQPLPGFNKATLLNYGIAQSQADMILLSDADILWNGAAVDALLATLASTPQAVCHIADVDETAPTTMALTRRRYRYTVTKSERGYQVTLQEAPANLPQRPGCGLVCAHRQTLLKLGGYKECFYGWGWEDQDLLMRARLMDLPVLAAGQVVHQSHAEALRNQFHAGLAPTTTRDQNIITCLEALQKGQIWGSLAPQLRLPEPRPQIQVHLPPPCR
ncbi:MAG: glycosyltransferase family 2 protein [Leptolyngbyaceae cyanobacterium]